MTRPLYRQRWSWVEGRRAVQQEQIPDIESADFALSTLADRGLLTTRQLADFQDATGLADMTWRAFWSRTALEEADGNYRSLLRRTQGFVIFMHGWGGSGDVWEHLPALTCAANSRLVALTPDLDGFGGTPFLADVPTVENCDPPAVVRSVVYWVNLLGLRSGVRARRRRRVITLVGHSMSGAALFYLDEAEWRDNELTRCAVAPALLIDGELRRGFFQALNLGLSSSRSADAPEKIRARLKPKVVEALVGDASQATRTEHLRVFESTPPGTLAQTLYALGRAPRTLEAKYRRDFRIIVGHDDSLLDVSQMLRLLDDLGFGSDQIQVVWGDHYLFSVGDRNRRMHLRNREVVLGAILHLHELCRDRQRR